jgi:hypothetical protein
MNRGNSQIACLGPAEKGTACRAPTRIPNPESSLCLCVLSPLCASVPLWLFSVRLEHTTRAAHTARLAGCVAACGARATATALDDHPRRVEDLAHFRAARRAFRNRTVRHSVTAFKPGVAGTAFVFIRWHGLLRGGRGRRFGLAFGRFRFRLRFRNRGRL